MEVGTNVSVDLLVKEAEIKQTRNGKPYLFTVLSDGFEDIRAQFWDYTDSTTPDRGSVVGIKAKVGEYLGNKQLTIGLIGPGSIPVENFAPQGDVDVSAYTKKASELIDGIVHQELRLLVRSLFNDNKKGWTTIPAASGIHHAYVGGLLQHTVDVALKAKALAELVPDANKDLVIAGALLHDVGKLFTYELNGAVIDRSYEGQMLEHIVLGIMEVNKYRSEHNSTVIDLILHIISAHHGVREYGSPTTPMFMEALIVNYADGIDAKTKVVLEFSAKASGEQTDKIWTMENNKIFTPEYIRSIMEG